MQALPAREPGRSPDLCEGDSAKLLPDTLHKERLREEQPPNEKTDKGKEVLAVKKRSTGTPNRADCEECPEQ